MTNLLDSDGMRAAIAAERSLAVTHSYTGDYGSPETDIRRALRRLSQEFVEQLAAVTTDSIEDMDADDLQETVEYFSHMVGSAMLLAEAMRGQK